MEGIRDRQQEPPQMHAKNCNCNGKISRGLTRTYADKGNDNSNGNGRIGRG